MSTPMQPQFSPRDAHLADTEAGRHALEEYALAIERGEDHQQAELLASNVLQRAGYQVNARGGVTILSAHSPQD